METAAKPKQDQLSLSPAQNLADIAISAQAISNAADTIIRTAGSDYGLADWALLDNLSKLEGAMPMAQMAGKLGVSRQRAQKQIDVLAEAKLLDVQVTEGDKRTRTVTLTKQGRESLAAVTALWELSLSKNEWVAKSTKLDVVRLRLNKVSTVLGNIARLDLKAAALAQGELEAKTASPKH